MNWKTIFNPFEKFDEKTLLTIGIIFFILLIPLLYITDSYFSSIYRIEQLEIKNNNDLLVRTAISFTVPIAVLYILGKLLYRKTRIIDIANTVLLSQIPLIVLLLLVKSPELKKAGERVSLYQNTHTGVFPIVDFILMLLVIVLTLLGIIYSFAILFNGFRTATNIKKWQHIVLFCSVVFLTTMICQLFNH